MKRGTTQGMAQAPGRSLDPVVRRSITSDQRQRFRRWSDAIGKLDDSTKSEEGEAWIASAIAILFTPNPTGHAPARSAAEGR